MTELPISAETAEWLKQALSDILNDDFLGAYQREQVGPVPADLCQWADVDPSLFGFHRHECDACGEVGRNGVLSGESFICEDCAEDGWT